MIGKLSFAQASYLLARTDIGVDWQKANRYQHLSAQAAIQQSLHQAFSHPPSPPSFTAWTVLSQLHAADYASIKKARRLARQEGIQLKLWWIKHLASTDNTLQERMVLFWHNHFTAANDKILQPELLWRQNQTIRRHALGNFADLLVAMLKDPALLIYLDGQMNQKGDLNENLARELLELFTIGLGQFNETDVKATASVLTGWQVDRAKVTSFFDHTHHEKKVVHLLGKAQHYSLTDLVQRLLAHPHTARTIAKKFWHEFISIEHPPASVINAWGKNFQRHNYDIKALLANVLNSDAFWSAQHQGNLIKSPIELIVGALRQLPYPAPPDAEMINMLKNLGQRLFDPPNVKGWAGGKNWINSKTLLIRNAFLRELARQNNDKPVYNQRLPQLAQQDFSLLNQWLLPIDPVLTLPTNQSVSARIRALILDPAYQLK
ncbi:MAG TPA: DUF1800 domain-containing protein [Thiothrix sp.]|nr:DUF1800 domain-containing protein [Thiothrix sp.]